MRNICCLARYSFEAPSFCYFCQFQRFKQLLTLFCCLSCTSLQNPQLKKGQAAMRFLGLKQFRFQPMKKCYNANCLTILVPKDFQSGSPRRMFCSWKCFDEHWRRKLAFYQQLKNPAPRDSNGLLSPAISDSGSYALLRNNN